MTLCGHCVGCVCVRRSVLARNPNKGLELEISHETRSGRGEEGPREDRGSVDKGRRRDAVDNVVQGKDGQQKETVREDSQKWVSILCGFCRSFARNTRLRETRDARRMQGVTKIPFLRLELTQVHNVCLFFLPPPRLYFVWPLWNVKYPWLEMKKKNH